MNDIQSKNLLLSRKGVEHIWKKIDVLELCDTNTKAEMGIIKGDVAVVRAELVGLRRDHNYLEERINRRFDSGAIKT
jgi:hypothetical protein